MKPTKIEGKRNNAKGELKQKSARSTKEENYIQESPAPTQWFCDWSVDGGEKRRIEACQSEAKNNKFGNLTVSYFCN